MVDAPAEVTRKTWRSVRERYGRIRNRVVADLPEDCAAEDADVLRTVRWPLYPLLDTFLRYFVTPRRPAGSQDPLKTRGATQPPQDLPLVFEPQHQASQAEDEHDAFGQLVAGRLRQMSELDAHRAQLKVLEILNVAAHGK